MAQKLVRKIVVMQAVGVNNRIEVPRKFVDAFGLEHGASFEWKYNPETRQLWAELVREEDAETPP